MERKLVGVEGPLTGNVYALGVNEFSIGRDPSNDITIPDREVSRRHCKILGREGNLAIEDLNSANGTFVNDNRVNQRRLENSDRIRIGSSTFLFVCSATAGLGKSQVKWEETGTALQTTAHIDVNETLFERPERAVTDLSANSSESQDLISLLEISAAISAVVGLEELQSKLLELVLRMVPAEWAVILLSGDSDEAPSVQVRRHPSFAGQAITISRTAVKRAMSDRTAILCSNIFDDEQLRDAASLVGTLSQSLLIVPMATRGKTLGALYFACSNPLNAFNEGHLRMMTAVAAMIAAPLENAHRLDVLLAENQRLRSSSKIEQEMVESPGVERIFATIPRIAASESAVIIQGERGTGKELVARAIHRKSSRAGGPFVVVDCAASREGELERELFGIEEDRSKRVAQTRGGLEEARSGTLFLDEIGELPLDIQDKLLGAWRDREFKRVGGAKPIKTDFRLMAATNRNLEEDVGESRFRRDLYQLLTVVSLRIPPLRERRQDISLLANLFALKYGERYRKRVVNISPDALSLLGHYYWPGNVRELENVIERAVVMGSSDSILPEDLPESLLETDAPEGVRSKYHQAVQDLKKQLVLSAFEQAGGRFIEAAKLLGVQAKYLERLTNNMNLPVRKVGVGR
jgi:transcriptional regulator with GAF, ATPase, and Fis domain